MRSVSRELSDAEYIAVRVFEPGYFGASRRVINPRRGPNSALILPWEAIILEVDSSRLELRHDLLDVRDFPSKNRKFLRCEFQDLRYPHRCAVRIKHERKLIVADKAEPQYVYIKRPRSFAVPSRNESCYSCRTQQFVTPCNQRRERNLEAAIGIEPMDKGFADLCLTTWLRRLHCQTKGEGNSCCLLESRPSP